MLERSSDSALFAGDMVQAVHFVLALGEVQARLLSWVDTLHLVSHIAAARAAAVAPFDSPPAHFSGILAIAFEVRPPYRSTG